MEKKFYLLGQCDAENPSAISRETLAQWEKNGAVEYLGSVDDVRPIIARCDCVVLPSYREGVPRVLLESLALKKPIITTNIAGCKECVSAPLVKNSDFWVGKNGILVPPKDARALKNAMLFLGDNPQMAREMGENGAEFVKRFDIGRIIGIYRGEISEILGETGDSSDSKKRRDSKDSKPKLAFISNTAFGMQNFRAPVLAALKSDFEIHIIAPIKRGDKSAESLAQQGYILHNLAVDSKSKNPLKDIKTALQIAAILRTVAPKVAFCYTIKCVIYGCFAASILKIPHIAVITGLGYAFVGDSWRKRALRNLVCFMYRIALKKARGVWFLNADDMAEFESRGIIARDLRDSRKKGQGRAVLLDSEGIDLAHFSADAVESCVDSRDYADIFVGKDEFRFLLVARMLLDKGVREFVEAAEAIP